MANGTAEGRKARDDTAEAGRDAMDAAQETMETGRQAMQDTTRQAADAAKQGAESAKRGIVAGRRGMDKMEEATMRVGDVSMEFYQDAMAFGRGNVDAIVKANMVVAQGYQEIFKALVGMAKEAIEDGFGKHAIDRVANRGTQITDLYMSMLEHAMEPINDRLSAAADTMKQTAERAQQRLGREGREGQR